MYVNEYCAKFKKLSAFKNKIYNYGSVPADLASGQQDLPRRVFAPLSGSGLSVCDYIFPDESPADVAERFKEMLGCDLSEGDVDTNMEAQSNVTYFIMMHEIVSLLGAKVP